MSPTMTNRRDFPILRQGEVRLLTLEHGSTSENLRYGLRAVRLARAPQYQALSYCWGATVPDNLLKIIIVNGERKAVRPTLYSFLMETAAKDSGILLWIDSICINQNNSLERNQQVSIMADIYRSAENVYVWLGRGDEDTDYAIEHIQDCNPRTAHVSSMFSNCVENLFLASYWRRRWVIQEFALAKRLIIACGKQQTTWNQIIKKVDNSVLLEDGTAWKTLKSFDDARKAITTKKLSVFQLLKQFQHSQCLDRRDRAYALRGIAEDGQHLTIKYNESVGGLFFRLLSMLHMEWILPVMTGYRWPHKAAKELITLLNVTKNDLLSSLRDGTEDLLFTVFEYVGTVINVTTFSDDEIEAGEFRTYFSNLHHVKIQGSETRHFYGKYTFKAGDVVYSLQSTLKSPKGLYIVLASDPTHRTAVGLLLEDPYPKFLKHLQKMRLTEQEITFIEDVLISGVIRCDSNVAVENSRRALFHINRMVLVVLWLLDIGQLEHLCDLKPSLSNLRAEEGSLCGCLKELDHSLRLGTHSPTSRNGPLEILPNFPTVDNDELWTAASVVPWSSSVVFPRPQDHRLDTSLSSTLGNKALLAHGRTQLSYAAREGHVGFIINLLTQFDNYTSRRRDDSQNILPLSNRVNRYGAEEPPLNWNNIRPDKKDKSGRTPLSYAAEYGHDAAVKLLIQRNDVATNSEDEDRRTPLSYAAARGHQLVVKLLIAKGKNIVNCGRNRTPLSYAAAGGHEAVVQLLLQRDDIVANQIDKIDGRTPLSYAAANGHEGIVKLLVARDDVTVNQRDYSDRTPLSYAAANGHEGIMKLLIARDDGNIDQKDKDGSTALSLAARDGREAVVKLLIARDDVVVDHKDKEGQMPLLLATSRGHGAVVALLAGRQRQQRKQQNLLRLEERKRRRNLAVAVAGEKAGKGGSNNELGVVKSSSSSALRRGIRKSYYRKI